MENIKYLLQEIDAKYLANKTFALSKYSQITKRKTTALNLMQKRRRKVGFPLVVSNKMAMLQILLTLFNEDALIWAQNNLLSGPIYVI